MPDERTDDHDLEAELAAFGRTLEAETGEPIRNDSNRSSVSTLGRVPRRWWAITGAAAACVVAIVGLVVVANREAPDEIEPAAPTETTLGIPSPTTTDSIDVGELPAAPEPVPSDPLGLEADRWRLIERDELPFEFPAELACPGTDALVDLNGASSVRDIVEPPDGTGVDVDINIIDVGSLDVGNAVADAFLAFGECVAAEVGAGPEIGAMSSIRATWFRTGPEFAIATIVGEGARTVVLEIENGVFTDDLIGDLVRRSATFLGAADPSSGRADAAEPATTTTNIEPAEPVGGGEAALPGLGDDPLSVLTDGWRQVGEGGFDPLEILLVGEDYDFQSDPSSCPGAAAASVLNGLDRYSVLYRTPGGATVSFSVVRVQSGADVDLLIESSAKFAVCLARLRGVTSESGSADSGGAVWNRIGRDHALITVASSEGGLTVLFEIDDGVFGDELIDDLIRRAEIYLTSNS